MAEYTPNLNLLKKDPATDGNDTFNIKTMLNDNWDKIDVFSQAIEEGLGNVDDVELAVSNLIEQVGNLEEVNTETKLNLVAAINEVYRKFNEHLADYAYQTPTIVGTQIRISKQSNTDRLYFKLDNTLIGSSITISLDGGISELPLKDVEGNNVTELEKGFVEVVAEANFFTLRPKGGKKIDDVDYTITSQGGQFFIPKGQHSGDGVVKAQFANLIPENIRKDVNVGEIIGKLRAIPENINLRSSIIKFSAYETRAFTMSEEDLGICIAQTSSGVISGNLFIKGDTNIYSFENGIDTRIVITYDGYNLSMYHANDGQFSLNGLFF